MALTTAAAVKARYSPAMDASQDAALATALTQADAWIKAATGRDIEEATYTEYFNGYGQTRLLLRAGRQPVLHEAAKYVTVTDSGTALTIDNALGYNTTADVFLENIGLDNQAIVHYRSGFSVGRQNITVTYSAGWGTVPTEIVALANEVAWLLFKSHQWVAKSQASSGRATVSWEKGLTPQALSTLNRLEIK